MGRIFHHIRINGSRHLALFDSGATQSYVVERLARRMGTQRLKSTLRVGLGGKGRSIREGCFLQGTIDGRRITTAAFVVPELGADPNAGEIEIIIGAETMEVWGIRLVPRERKLDLSHFRDFLEEF